MRANGNSTHEILGKIVTAIASIAMTAAFAVPAMAASDSGTAADSGTEFACSATGKTAGISPAE